MKPTTTAPQTPCPIRPDAALGWVVGADVGALVPVLLRLLLPDVWLALEADAEEDAEAELDILDVLEADEADEADDADEDDFAAEDEADEEEPEEEDAEDAAEVAEVAEADWELEVMDTTVFFDSMTN